MLMYALSDANGQLGRLVIKHLLAQVPANQIIATTRDPHKLAAAYAGASRLLISMPRSPTRRHRTLTAAHLLAAAGVR